MLASDIISAEVLTAARTYFRRMWLALTSSGCLSWYDGLRYHTDNDRLARTRLRRVSSRRYPSQVRRHSAHQFFGRARPPICFRNDGRRRISDLARHADPVGALASTGDARYAADKYEKSSSNRPVEAVELDPVVQTGLSENRSGPPRESYVRFWRLADIPVKRPMCDFHLIGV